MVDQPDSGKNRCNRAQRYYQSAKAGIRNAYRACQESYAKTGRYLGKPKNIIQALTLVFVGTYTVISCQQANVAADQEHRQLRAYIGPVFGSFQLSMGPNATPGNPPFPIVVVYKVKNYGLTPAERPVSCAAVINLKKGESLDSRVEKDYRSCERRDRVPTALPTVWPGEERFNVAGIETPQFVDEAITDERAVFLANITYFDVFNDPHHTYVCESLYRAADGPKFRNCKTRVARTDD